MRRTVSNLIVIGSQLLIVSLFFATVFNKDIRVEKYVSTVHNENLNKIATSVSLLFKEEKIENVEDKLNDMTLEDLPSIDKVTNDVKEIEENEVVSEDKSNSSPLSSIDASKYINNEEMGFKVTENNKQYALSDYEFDVVVAIVSGEFDKDLNDALGVVSVILNRCDSEKWIRWAGASPYDQVVKQGQFEVYSSGSYLQFMPNGSRYGSEKYNVAKQAVMDGLNGIRNNGYLGFRAWWISSYSDKYIIDGGNRYGYN